MIRSKIHAVLNVAIMVCGLTFAFGSVPSFAQSSAPSNQQPPQPTAGDSDDLINADRPGIADGSTVIGPKRIQIESGVQAEFRRNADSREHTLFVATLLRIGIDSNWEARVEGNTFTRVTTITPGLPDTRSSGIGPLSFGFKYHFQDSKGIRHPSLGAIVRVFPSWGSGDFATHHVTGDVRLAADWDFAPKLSLNPNVGIGRYEDDRGRTFTAAIVAATLNYLPTKRINPFIDMGLQAPEQTAGKTSVIFDAGIAYILGRNLQLDASAGTGAHGATPPHPFISFGISYRIGFARQTRP
jgi:hypothetical protein